MGKSKGEQIARGDVRRPMAQVSSPADWGQVDAGILRGCIAAAGRAGGAVRCGYTRDGGAFAIGVYGLGDPYTAYVRPGEDIAGFLTDLAHAFAGD